MKDTKIPDFHLTESEKLEYLTLYRKYCLAQKCLNRAGIRYGNALNALNEFCKNHRMPEMGY